MPSARTTWRHALAALAGIALALGDMPLSSTSVAAAAASTPSAGVATTVLSTSSASLAWRRCRGAALRHFRCTTLRVPKDYDDASAGAFGLAVARLRATGPRRQRIGSLVFNPGGPGVAAIDLAPSLAGALPKQVRRRFDFVVWDPRGVGRSAGLTRCTGGEYRLPATGPVDWKAVLEQMRTAEAAANAACEARYPDIVPYISTNATVRDLDVLRAALGDRRLTYWGTSYGTRIGALYAREFPSRVRAMLLSSSVDPDATWASFTMQAAVASDDALGLVFEAYRGTAGRYRRVMRTLRRHTLKLAAGREFSRWHVRATMSQQATADANYRALAKFIRTVDTALHDKGNRRAEARRSLARSEWPDAIPMNGGATTFIGCLDYAARIDPADQQQLYRRLRAQAPLVGFGAAQALVYCEGITVAPDPVPVDFVNWRTPMLIVGSTRDALTPYAWTVNMARTFRNSRVVTFVGGQHTPFLAAGSRCVDRYGIRYLVKLRRPKVDVACPSVLP